MVDAGATGGTTAGGGGDSTTSSRMTSSFVKVGDRTRFTVELRPGETTIVSWKKFAKDAAKAGGSSSSAPAPATVAVAAVTPEAPASAHPSLESRLGSGETPANDLKDAPAPNRFSAVIEKIERLYMGKDSSDEENGIPDDDQYDTEDSFIDDEELDEYFEVDKSKTKHDGYFVNRGALEKVSETLELTNQQPKKRRRKEITKAADDIDPSHHFNKHIKVGRKRAGKFASSVGKNMLPTTQESSVKNLEEMKIQSQYNASGTYHQKMAGDDKPLLDFTPLRTSNGDASSCLAESCDKQKTSMLPTKNSSSKLKENIAEESAQAMQQKDKSGMREKIDLNLPDSKHMMQSAKTYSVNKKEGSSLKPKANSLEKAIRELEKMVAESRPPTSDTQDTDASSSIKRRLPREIKLKLAKVARLANASNGKISKELLNRLMGIVGHLCQIRTLKRHLKIMMNTSVSAKQEKDDKFQQIKKDVIKLIEARVPSLISKGAEQQSGGSGDVQESGNSDKALKGQLCMDALLEDKICDLYDIFVDGLDEDAAPQVRKLYAELAELWPRGFMDNHGIKRAICRAKERKKSLNETNKFQFSWEMRKVCGCHYQIFDITFTEKVKRKKVVATKIDDNVRVESSSLPQLQQVDYRLGTDPTIAPVAHQNRFISSTTTSSAATQINPTNIAAVSLPIPPVPSTHLPNFERPKHEKVKATLNSSLIVDGVVVKKKVKRKTEIPGEGSHMRAGKLSSHQGDNNRQKQHKHAATAPFQGASHNKSSYDVFRFDPLT